MNNQPSYLTIVYTIFNNTSFSDECEKIIGNFIESRVGIGVETWGITAVSPDNEIHRIKLLTEAIQRNDLVAAKRILSMPCVDQIVRSESQLTLALTN